MATVRNGGDVHVDYMLMPLTAEETLAGGECLGARYAMAHKDRWINVNHLTFDLQTYDRGFTWVRVNGKTYQIHHDTLESELRVRLYIGKYVGTEREEELGGLQVVMPNATMGLFTWKELVALGVITEAAEVSINYAKLMNADGTCKIGNAPGAVRLVIPPKTTTGVAITGVVCSDTEASWKSATFPARYIYDVILPEGLKSIGNATKSAFPMLGKNVMSSTVDIKVPKTVTTIGKKAFYGSNIRTISGDCYCSFTGNDALESIAASAFENCTKLTVIRLNPKVATIGSKAFGGCKKAQVWLAGDLKSIAADACYMVGDVEYTHPEPVPAAMAKAPFGAQLLNGRIGDTIGFYKRV